MSRLTIIVPLQGEQLNLLPNDTIATRSGSATVTRTETTGKEQIIWADYGSGIEQPHTAEELSPEQQYSQNERLLRARAQPQRHRRYSPKGKATGWIEERQGNLKRKKPSTSYYYCWQNSATRGKTYIPTRQMSQIRAMVDARCSVDEILQAISKRPTPHHTDSPKL